MLADVIPVFAVHMGMTKAEVLQMSVPEIVDTIDYYRDIQEMRGRANA